MKVFTISLLANAAIAMFASKGQKAKKAFANAYLNGIVSDDIIADIWSNENIPDLSLVQSKVPAKADDALKQLEEIFNKFDSEEYRTKVSSLTRAKIYENKPKREKIARTLLLKKSNGKKASAFAEKLKKVLIEKVILPGLSNPDIRGAISSDISDPSSFLFKLLSTASPDIPGQLLTALTKYEQPVSSATGLAKRGHHHYHQHYYPCRYDHHGSAASLFGLSLIIIIILCFVFWPVGVAFLFIWLCALVAAIFF